MSESFHLLPNNLVLDKLTIFNYNGELINKKINVNRLTIFGRHINRINVKNFRHIEDFKFNELL